MKQLQTSARTILLKLIVFLLFFTLGTPSNVLAQTKTPSSTPTLSSPLALSPTPIAIDSSLDASSPVPETHTLSDFAGKVFFRGAGFNMGIDNPDQARRLTDLTLKNSISETCNAHELSDNGGHPRATLRSDAQHGLATEGTLDGYHWIVHSTGLIYKKDTLWTTTVKLENNPNNSVRILPVILDNFVTSSKPRSELRYLAVLRGIKFFNTSQNGFGGKTLWFGLSPALRADGEILDVTITPNVTSFEGTRDYTNDVYIDVIVYDPDHWGHKGFSWYSASQAGNSVSTTGSGDATQRVMSQTLDLGIPLASKEQAFVGLFRYGYNTSSTTPFEYDAMQARAHISGISGNNLTVQMAGAVYGHNGAFATDSVRVMNPTELKGYVIYCKNPETCRASTNSLGYGSNNYWGTHEIVENQAYLSNENDCHAEVHYDITLDAVTLSSSPSSAESSPSIWPSASDLILSASTTDLTGSADTGSVKDSSDSLLDRDVEIIASTDSTGPADTGSDSDSSDSLLDSDVEIVASTDSTGPADTGSDSDSSDSLVNRDVEILPTLECSAGFVPSGAQNTSMAFAWSQEMGADATFSNVISPPYLSWNEGWCGDPARIVWQDPAVEGGPCHWLIGNDPRPTVTDMADLVAKTNAHPTGHRALRPFNAYHLHEYDSQSNTWKMRWRDKFPNGQENLWFDDWMTQGYTTMRNWFLEYKQAGGELDVIILDFEDGLTWWQLSPQFSNDQELIRNWISLVQADPRWPALRDRLNAKAISVGYAPSVNFNDISDIAGWSNMDPRRYVWNDVMHERTAEALDHIVFDAARVYFPSVRGSEYEHHLRKSDTHRSGQYIDLHSNSPVGKGKVVGTHSVKETYGSIPVKFLIESSSNPMLPSGPLVQSNPPLINNAFDLLIFEHRFFRGMRAADFNTPVSVWITGNEPKGIFKSVWLSSGYADTDEWYIENIFHLGLVGVKDFLLFNPDNNSDGAGERSPDGSGEQLVHDALDELDSLAGFSNRESAPLLTLDAPNWDTDTYLLTGMRIHGWDIYRFTPRLAAEVIAACPATFKIEGKTTVPVPGASIYAPEGGSLSAKGYWLVVEADSGSDSSDSLVDRDVKIIENTNDILPAGDLVASAEPDSSDSLPGSDVELVASIDSTGPAETGSDSDSSDSTPDSDIKIVENPTLIDKIVDFFTGDDEEPENTETGETTGEADTTEAQPDGSLDDKPTGDSLTTSGRFFVANENDNDGSNPVGVAEYDAGGQFVKTYNVTTDTPGVPMLSMSGLAQVWGTVYASGNFLYEMNAATETDFSQLTLTDSSGNPYSGDDNVNAMCRYNGQLVIVGSAGGWIHVYDPVTGDFQHAAAQGLSTSPQGCVQVGADLYVIARDKIYKLAKGCEGFTSEIFFDLGTVDSNHFSEGNLEAHGNYLFYTNHAPDWNTGHLVAVDLTTRQGRIVSSIERNPRGIDIDPAASHIYVSQMTNASVVRIDLGNTLDYLSGTSTTPPAVEPFIHDEAHLSGPFGLHWLEEASATTSVATNRENCGDPEDSDKTTTGDGTTGGETDETPDKPEDSTGTTDTTSDSTCGNKIKEDWEACDDALPPPEGFTCDRCRLVPVESDDESRPPLTHVPLPLSDPTPTDGGTTSDPDAESKCGNGLWDQSEGEECDTVIDSNHNLTPLGYDPTKEICSECRIYAIATPPAGEVASECGDGQVEGTEQCELPNIGFNPDTQKCENCIVSQRPSEDTTPSGGPAETCGNGKREGTEQCDGRDGLTNQGGNITEICTSDCQIVQMVPNPEDQAPVCGNGVLEYGEQCDQDVDKGLQAGFDPEMQTCEDCRIALIPRMLQPANPDEDGGKTDSPENEGDNEESVDNVDGVESLLVHDEEDEESDFEDVNEGEDDLSGKTTPTLCGNGQLDEGEQCDPALIMAEGEGLTIRICNYRCQFVTLVLEHDHEQDHEHAAGQPVQLVTPKTTTPTTQSASMGSSSQAAPGTTPPVSTTGPGSPSSSATAGTEPATGISGAPTQPAGNQAQGGVSPQPFGGYGFSGGGCQLAKDSPNGLSKTTVIFFGLAMLALIWIRMRMREKTGISA